MEFELPVLLLIIVLGFIAAFIDAVVGGGGLISIPALLATGMSPATALGTNKLASAFGSFTSSMKFLRSRNVDFRRMMKLFPVSVLVSIAGAFIAVRLPGEVLKPLVLVMLIIVLVYTLFKKDWGAIEKENVLSKRKVVILIVFVILIGFYDGFMGGGTGSFLLFLMLFTGFDFLRAAGNAKVLNFGSNIGALLLFIIMGEVNYSYGLAMAASMVLGSYTGAHLAISKGVGYVRALFIIVTSVLILKNIYDFIS
ncbi:MAG TPA: TSUP family transporter [Candidatus Salinicoccus stercoripullorum]|uniref:Probable membrane transporter protein n=1 Tax=Candidatus Salinicoccus stercoripullorum TaxID=2838756 RepID=A0A9D1TZS7_9STAP|nr:TSUP family transporter [Candidatus Salinicoccus stercoripullorum]